MMLSRVAPGGRDFSTHGSGPLDDDWVLVRHSCTCEVTLSNVAQGFCYMVEGLPHTVSCSGGQASVSVYGTSATGLTCSSDLTGMTPEVFTHPSGVCEADAHDHGDHYEDDHVREGQRSNARVTCHIGGSGGAGVC